LQCPKVSPEPRDLEPVIGVAVQRPISGYARVLRVELRFDFV